MPTTPQGVRAMLPRKVNSGTSGTQGGGTVTGSPARARAGTTRSRSASMCSSLASASGRSRRPASRCSVNLTHGTPSPEPYSAPPPHRPHHGQPATSRCLVVVGRTRGHACRRGGSLTRHTLTWGLRIGHFLALTHSSAGCAAQHGAACDALRLSGAGRVRTAGGSGGPRGACRSGRTRRPCWTCMQQARAPQ